MMKKPAGMTFEEAAAIPQGGVIAFNGIIKKGYVQAEQKVLINGAGGSGGTFAVQLAKLQGAEVTGVDNASKLDFLRSLGVDHVMDYMREDFTKSGKRFDLILDMIAHRSAFTYPRALNTNGMYLFTGGSLTTLFQILILGPLIKRTTGKNVRMLVVPQNRDDLIAITKLIEAGKVHPVIDKIYSFDKIPEAMHYVNDGHAKGKAVITVE